MFLKVGMIALLFSRNEPSSILNDIGTRSLILMFFRVSFVVFLNPIFTATVFSTRCLSFVGHVCFPTVFILGFVSVSMVFSSISFIWSFFITPTAPAARNATRAKSVQRGMLLISSIFVGSSVFFSIGSIPLIRTYASSRMSFAWEYSLLLIWFFACVRRRLDFSMFSSEPSGAPSLRLSMRSSTALRRGSIILFISLFEMPIPSEYMLSAASSEFSVFLYLSASSSLLEMLRRSFALSSCACICPVSRPRSCISCMSIISSFSFSAASSILALSSSTSFSGIGCTYIFIFFVSQVPLV